MTGPMLAGVVDVPAGEVRGWGVFAHGFTLGKDCPAASRICKQWELHTLLPGDLYQMFAAAVA